MATKATNNKPTETKVTLSVPMARVPEACYSTRHIDFHLTPVQLDTLAQIQHGLIRERATLANGQLVQNAPGAMRWMLERVADKVRPVRP